MIFVINRLLQQEEITQLSDLDFDNYTNKLVKFVTPFCANCNLVQQHFNELIKENIGNNTQVTSVNCQQYRSLCQRFAVREQPHIKLFYQNNTYTYYGSFKHDQLKQWFNDITSEYTIYETKQQCESIVNKSNPYFLLQVNKNAKMLQLQKLKQFAYQIQLCAYYNNQILQYQLTNVRNNVSSPFTQDIQSQNQLQLFINQYKYKIVEIVDESNFQELKQKNLTLIVVNMTDNNINYKIYMKELQNTLQTKFYNNNIKQSEFSLANYYNFAFIDIDEYGNYLKTLVPVLQTPFTFILNKKALSIKQLDFNANFTNQIIEIIQNQLNN